jgi:hypothetical protein
LLGEQGVAGVVDFRGADPVAGVGAQIEPFLALVELSGAQCVYR